MKKQEAMVDEAMRHFRMATEYHQKKHFSEAVRHYEEVLKIVPHFLVSRENAARCCLGQEDYARAADNFLILARSVPDNREYRFLLLYSLKHLDAETAPANIREALLVCLSDTSLKHLWIFDLWLACIRSTIHFDASKPDTLNDPLLLRGMDIFICADDALEQPFTKIRATLLEKAANGENLQAYRPFLIALSQQCYLTEYVYAVLPHESAILEQMKPTDEATTLILSCYKRLTDPADWKHCHCPETEKEQAQDYHREEDIKRNIKTIGRASDVISVKVRDMYEESPYPRWKYATDPLEKTPPAAFSKILQKSQRPEILFAGCGTGHQIHTIVTLLPEARFTAVDLSHASLAYAIRKGQEAGHGDKVEYAQMDILDVAQLGKRFDIIICTGVLHHMADPARGWQALCSVLAPGGVMEIGLYSKAARKEITHIKEQIKNLPPTIINIRALREALRADPHWGPSNIIARTMDFYSSSGCRDLLFHVQEHCFTIPQIKENLEKLSLRFLGFNFADIKPLKAYRQKYPADTDATSLDNWHAFETANPHIFKGMYQFYVEKRG